MQGRCMRVEPMIGRVTGDDSYIRVHEYCMLGRESKTAIGLFEIPGRVMQVREVSDFHVASIMKKSRPVSGRQLN